MSFSEFVSFVARLTRRAEIEDLFLSLADDGAETLTTEQFDVFLHGPQMEDMVDVAALVAELREAAGGQDGAMVPDDASLVSFDMFQIYIADPVLNGALALAEKEVRVGCGVRGAWGVLHLSVLVRVRACACVVVFCSWSL